MARFVVVIPVVTIVDSGSSSSLSNDQAISLASTWLALPANSGSIAASAKQEGHSYDASQISNAQISTIKQILP